MEEYEVFVETVKRLVKAELGDDYRIYTKRIQKNNNVFLSGLMIRYKDVNVCPTIYLEKYFYEFRQGKPLEDIVFDVLTKYSQVKNDTLLEPDLSFSAVKSNIIYRLVNREKNDVLLRSCPKAYFLDLAVTFHIVMDEITAGEQATIRVTNEMMMQWETDTEQLMKMAAENTPKRMPPRILTLQEILCETADAEKSVEIPEEEEQAAYILTNECKLYGATAILYQGVVADFAEKMQTDLYLLPSSVHEFIMIPKSEKVNKDELAKMVRDINATRLPEEEFLSDYVYYYGRKEEKLTKL